MSDDKNLEEDLAAVLDVAALAAGTRTPAPAALKSRLLGSLRATPRFAHFEDRVAAMLQIPVERARVVLRAFDDPGVWVRELPMAEFFWVERGPALQNAVCGFVRVDRGTTFPEHEHLGHERVLMIQGALVDAVTGERFGPGDISEREAGSRHAYVAEDGGVDMVHLVVADVGYRFGEIVAGPRDPADY